MTDRIARSADPGDVEIARGYTVLRYRELAAAQDRVAISNLVRRRFEDRYLDPVDNSAPERHGFAMMAIACLMVEALESFVRGWPTTDGKSGDAFCSFFDRWEPFAVFRGNAREFYRNVRCGILHQAETTGGWRIRRDGPLFNAHSHSINASKFLATLRDVLDQYLERLRTSDWNSEEWKALRKKLNAICRNAVP